MMEVKSFIDFLNSCPISDRLTRNRILFYLTILIIYITGTMKRLRLSRVLVILLLLVAGAAALSAEVKNVVSVEAGYAYALSARDVVPGSPHGLLASLNYGYVIHEKPGSMTALSLVLGYNLFPQGDGPDALNAMVYGVEYAHTFFRQKPVSLILDYGLLFNLIKQENRSGYAFGHHTRLGVGGLYNLNDRHKLALKGAYNFVTFPYFELSEARITFPSVALRYYFYY
jgi:hypothetical protein